MVDGRPDLGVMSTGQVVGLVDDLPTVADLITRIITEADALLTGFAGKSGIRSLDVPAETGYATARRALRTRRMTSAGMMSEQVVGDPDDGPPIPSELAVSSAVGELVEQRGVEPFTVDFDENALRSPHELHAPDPAVGIARLISRAGSGTPAARMSARNSASSWLAGGT